MKQPNMKGKDRQTQLSSLFKTSNDSYIFHKRCIICKQLYFFNVLENILATYRILRDFQIGMYFYVLKLPVNRLLSPNHIWNILEIYSFHFEKTKIEKKFHYQSKKSILRQYVKKSIFCWLSIPFYAQVFVQAPNRAPWNLLTSSFYVI